jgi:outer membrane protein assembly factor BamB
MLRKTMANEKPKPAMGARTKVLVMLFPTLSHAMALGRITHPNMPKHHYSHWSVLIFAGMIAARVVAEPAVPGAASFDWPAWRGASRDSISTQTNLNWSALAKPKVLWRGAVGKGFSSFAVVAGKVYTLGNTNDQDTVFCLDAATGQEIWKHSYPSPAQPLAYEGGPSATPAIDGNRLYTLSKGGDCFCLDSLTGRIIWSRKFEPPPKTKEDYNVWWGFAGSPLVMGDQLILAVGTGALAVDKLTSKTLWDNGPGRPGYSSPVPFLRGQELCFAFLSGHEIVGGVAATGKMLWRIPWRTTWDQNAADVVVAENKLFVSTGHGVGCALFDIQPEKPVELWRNKNMRSELASCVLWKGNLYGFDAKRLTCLDWRTGAVKWAAEDTVQGSLILADGKLIALQENGMLLIAEATDQAYRVVAQTETLPGRCWTLPVLADGRIFVRNAQGAIACLEVRPNQANPNR